MRPVLEVADIFRRHGPAYHRAAKLTLCRDLLAAPPPPDPEPPRRWQDRLRDLTGQDIDLCPGCGGRMLPHGMLRP